jgi:NADH-quinone oxidoreductase subunit E
MDGKATTRDDMFWALVWWAIALAVGIVVFFLLSLLIADDPAAGLIFGGVAFVLVGALMVRFGPGPGPNQEVWHNPDVPQSMTHFAPATPRVSETENRPLQGATAHAAADPLVPASEPVAPVVAAGASAMVPPVAAPTVGDEALPPGTGISERVRDAARSAGEAARALSGGDVGQRPVALSAPREGVGDDLKRLRGIGRKYEVVLHDLGIYHFDQIAAWGPEEIAWIEANLDGFSDRVVREDWVGQARVLAAGGETEHSRRVDRGEAT